MIFGIKRIDFLTAKLDALQAKYDEMYMAMEKVASILQKHDQRLSYLEDNLKKAWDANREFAENEKKLLAMAQGEPQPKPTLH